MTGKSASPSDAQALAAQQALQAAVLALRSGQPQEAERIAAQVLVAYPGHIDAAGILGRAMMLQNRAIEAVPVLEQVVRQGGNAAVETQFADALAATGRRDDALAQLRQTIMRRPAFPPSFVTYARHSADAGNLDDAIAVLRQGLALFPGGWELENELATLLIKANDRAEARAVLSRALATAPEHPSLLMTWGHLLYLAGDYAAAADVFERLLAANPAHAAANVNLAACRLEMNMRDAGEAALQAAVRTQPQLAGRALSALASAAHGRFFLRQGAATDFLRGGES